MARRALREALHAWNLAHLGDTATLLVSELVGNAIRHARATTPGLQLRLTAYGTLLRIEVLDQDPRTPTVRRPSDLDESGYGLVLVQALADQWGVRELAIGKSGAAPMCQRGCTCQIMRAVPQPSRSSS